MITIRKSTLSDSDEIQKLLCILVGREEKTQLFNHHFSQILNDERYHLLVAECKKRTVGVAMGILCKNLSISFSPFLVIEDVVVAEDFRRKGIGKRLILELEKFSMESGCKYITLTSQHKRKEAHRLYLKLGFVHDDAFQKFF